MRWGVLAANVCDRVDIPRVPRFEATIWTEEEVRLFLAEAKRSSVYYPLYLAAILTGARSGELAARRWRDVNFTLGTATIQQTFYRLGRRQIFKEPKSQRARRTITLPAVLVEELRRVSKAREERRRLLGAAYHVRDLVFCQPDGKPLHALPKGLPRIRFHDLRRGHVSWLLRQGEDIKVMQERLGHSTPAFTWATYAHTLPGQHERAAERLADRLLGNVKKHGPEEEAH